jgi:hypothetical protein
MKRWMTTTAGIAGVVLASAAPAYAAQPARSGVYRFADGSQVVGAVSTLVTGSAGASFTLRTSGLPAGHTVTVWYVVFNDPGNCTHGESGLRCGPGDLPPYGGNDSAVTSIVYAAGHVVGRSGTAAFAGHLATADTSGALFGPGLINPTGADIHLIVQDDGVPVQFSPHEQR